MMIADSLLAGTLLSAVYAASTGSYLLGALSGTLLSLTIIAAHNFFHQKDNLRMYYFDLSFMSSRNWRVSHTLSHHLYTNTVQDLEISIVEPFLQYLPRKSKPWWIRYGAWIASPFVYSFAFHSFVAFRAANFLQGDPDAVRKEDFLPLVVPALMIYWGSGLVASVIMWTWIILVASFVFGFIGLNAAHHHPDIFHDGDTPRIDRDWGLAQMDSVRDRPEISKSLFLALVTFGDHCLHHLFPTVDHSHLPRLRASFEETCKMFGIQEQTSSVLELIKGQFRQLANNSPNTSPPDKQIK